MAIEIKNVSKSFGSTRALDQVNIRIREKCIVGLLGNNGAGKTTLLNVITNRLYPDAGEVTVDGEPVADNDQALSKLFMMGEQTLYPEDMRVRKAFEVSARLYPEFDLRRAKELSEMFELNVRKKITALSTGYNSIFKLIVALSVNTPYLLLDEPVLGLDARHRDMFYKLLIEKYAQNDCTIIVSTHLIQEISNLIEHTLIIRNGRIIKDMPRDELLAGSYTVSGPAGLVDSYLEGKTVITQNNLGGLKTACLQGTPDDQNLTAGLEIGSVNLQDYFISLMNGEEEIS
jgi:ABC-2 type transport system ATP-binding protein